MFIKVVSAVEPITYRLNVRNIVSYADAHADNAKDRGGRSLIYMVDSTVPYAVNHSAEEIEALIRQANQSFYN